ncbi:DUF4083 family protein [Pseudalkalibacillus berkeleyi]|uniref:DUF4083 family protein n=1 Tax=Pseudalkalibacillus berkeleyi TaxID=1069813 RepID=A0ABS9H426_9BACL|nr:DUF4083 family protein [Pseudalkalibacillus berkeleyi]MCF6138720.1 DUF4083 family protein [Pseudalkalibacillus berkeleyi]
MNVGDILYQLFAFLILIGLVLGIVFVVKYMRGKQRSMDQMNEKLDRLIEEKQKD